MSMTMSASLAGCIVLALCVAHTAAVSTTTSAATMAATATETTTMMGTTTDGGYCPLGWGEPFESSCYRLMLDMGNFTEAEDTCVGEGGHLVSISDPGENTFVYNLSNSPIDTWIGLYRDASEECSADYKTCNWTWHDGTVPGYFNWQTEGPDIGSLPCASMRGVDGTWISNAFCANHRKFVCEQNVLFPTTTQEITTTMTTTNGLTSEPTGDMVSMTTSSERTPGGDNVISMPTPSEDDQTALIAGCVVGGVALLVIIVVVVVLSKKCRNSPQTPSPQDPSRTATKEITPKYSSKPSAGAYEDVDLDNRGFQATPPDTNAHGGAGVKPPEDEGPVIYAEPTKKADRGSNSGGVTVQENTLYAPGHMV